jgi:IclR family transcriptional regulator, mhp operon transcriptional activator
MRGLERGLQVLEFLRSTATASLHELHEATGIPKPSLLRILSTLSKHGLASRRLADGRYRYSDFGTIAHKRDRYAHIAEAAVPVLDRLCRKVLWPSDLMVPAGDHMERCETSQAHSPFFPHRTQRNRVGQPVGWLLTGVGRAYLAFCSEAERERIVRRLRNSKKPEDGLARYPKRLEQILAEVRAHGYARRDPMFTGGSYGGPVRNDGLASIAVPLLGERRVYGSLNILWIKAAFSVEQFAERHLADLQQAAADIVDAVDQSRRF